MRKFAAVSAVVVVLSVISYVIYLLAKKTPITVGDGSFIIDPVDPNKWSQTPSDVYSQHSNVTISSVELWQDGCSSSSGWCKVRTSCSGNCSTVKLVYSSQTSKASLTIAQLNSKMHARWADPTGHTSFSDFVRSGNTLTFDKFQEAKITSIEVNQRPEQLGPSKNRVKIYFAGL